MCLHATLPTPSHHMGWPVLCWHSCCGATHLPGDLLAVVFFFGCRLSLQLGTSCFTPLAQAPLQLAVVLQTTEPTDRPLSLSPKWLWSPQAFPTGLVQSIAVLSNLLFCPTAFDLFCNLLPFLQCAAAVDDLVGHYFRAMQASPDEPPSAAGQVGECTEACMPRGPSGLAQVQDRCSAAVQVQAACRVACTCSRTMPRTVQISVARTSVEGGWSAHCSRPMSATLCPAADARYELLK